MKKIIAPLFVVLSLFGLQALAVPPDYTALVTAIDMSTTVTAILAIAAIMMGVYIAWKGAKMIINMFKGA